MRRFIELLLDLLLEVTELHLYPVIDAPSFEVLIGKELVPLLRLLPLPTLGVRRPFVCRSTDVTLL